MGRYLYVLTIPYVYREERLVTVSPPDHLAVHQLERLRMCVKQVRELRAKEAWPVQPGDFGRETWIAVACRNGLRHVAYLHGAGKPWLEKQPEDIHGEIESAEAELRMAMVDALAEGAGTLPVDIPSDEAL